MAAVLPVGAVAAAATPALSAPGAMATPAVYSGSFESLVMNGLARVDAKVAAADSLISRVALGEAIPVHQVTLALEEARIAVELASQVRTRLVETWRDFMTMQV